MIEIQSPRPGDSGAIDDLVAQALALEPAVQEVAAPRPADAEQPRPASTTDEPTAAVAAGHALQERGWASRLAVFDLETTGVDTSTARIVTAFLGVLDERGELVEQHAWLADPGIEIPQGAAAIHGITTERARAEGQPARDVVAAIVAELSNLLRAGTPVVAYNAAYDLTVLHHEALRHGIAPVESPAPVIDPLVLDKQVDRYRKGKRTLGVTCAHYGIELDGWHEASADAIAAGRLAQAMHELFPQLQVPADELHASTIDWATQQAESFARYMQRRDPAFAADRGWPIREPRRA
ncbi:3'-5' exonuclease [Agrococcus sp. SGAir0287]|uniref:3'-5' exonuclease n=1 Tax=Agrococcus sp. SGAir0287 TaxID=2070347 RepID=UPI0034A0C97D